MRERLHSTFPVLLESAARTRAGPASDPSDPAFDPYAGMAGFHSPDEEQALVAEMRKKQVQDTLQRSVDRQGAREVAYTGQPYVVEDGVMNAKRVFAAMYSDPKAANPGAAPGAEGHGHDMSEYADRLMAAGDARGDHIPELDAHPRYDPVTRRIDYSRAPMRDWGSVTNNHVIKAIGDSHSSSRNSQTLLPWDALELNPQSCHAYLAQQPPGFAAQDQMEKCNLCELIVENRFKWNWRKHYSSLCENVPRHMMQTCMHWVCRMATNCESFISGSCQVNGRQRWPCPPKYMCWHCLNVPSLQTVGCFDKYD